MECELVNEIFGRTGKKLGKNFNSNVWGNGSIAVFTGSTNAEITVTTWCGLSWDHNDLCDCLFFRRFSEWKNQKAEKVFMGVIDRIRVCGNHAGNFCDCKRTAGDNIFWIFAQLSHLSWGRNVGRNAVLNKAV